MDSISDPPFEEKYKFLLLDKTIQNKDEDNDLEVVEECELPMIDLSRLRLDDEMVKEEIARASQEWGFFQVVNHGISRDVFTRLRCEQEKVFKQPFEKKTKEDKFFNFSAGSYRWGTPTATCLRQLSWSEAFHIPLTDIIESNGSNNTLLSSSIEEFGSIVSKLAQRLADILAERIGDRSSFFKENCVPKTCYLRLNRYPPCPIINAGDGIIHGLMPHTDSDFLTILYQDQVGGLQLVKDNKWLAVKPNPNALIVNIGDLFQAWSNGIYKSVEHRVMSNPKIERFSMAYFFCPSNDTMIESCSRRPSIYRKFSFQEYRQQVREDVHKLGSKIGLPRFLTHTPI